MSLWPNPSPRTLRLLILLATIITGLVFLGAAQRTYRVGFPLDDAWIHQTYARNLVDLGEWSFILGEPSAGSTAPLWSALLAVGYALDLSNLIWAYAVGVALLAITAWLAVRWLALRLPQHRHLVWTVALLIPFEWHLAWASVSGMETLAFAALALLCFYLLEKRGVDLGMIGLLIGLGVWLRPDALTLAMIPVGHLLLRGRGPDRRNWLRLSLGLMLALAPYFALQRSLSGEWWPNTFFAKQAEFDALRDIPYFVRILAQVGVPGAWLGAGSLDTGGPLVGVLAMLAPGLALSAKHRVRSRDWGGLLPLGWCLTYLATYALRLPVTYQHGRYAIPTIPVFVVLGVEGMISWLDVRSISMLRRALSRAWILLVPIILLYFWIAGAGAYGRDVAIIESEMVDTAIWIDGNTREEAVVAAHDIGALGFFAYRDLVDLAGLVNPEVIPILRDEPALARHLELTQADFLMTFPGVYPRLTSGRTPIFVTEGGHSPAAGGENMAVYDLNAR